MESAATRSESKRRTWCKLHLGIDEATQDIMAVDLTGNSVGDQEHLAELLNKAPQNMRLKQVSADGIYDSHACYAAAHAKGARLVTPPRHNAITAPRPSAASTQYPCAHV